MTAGFSRLLRIVVFGHDHVGHGRSSGERVQAVVSFEEDYVMPVLAHCLARRGHSELPLFLLGHSMGGLIACLASMLAEKMSHATEKSLVAGIVLTGPMIEVDPDLATPFNIFLARWLSWLWPSKQLDSLNEDDITRDGAAVQAIKNDPLCWHGGIKVRQAYLALQALEAFEKDMETLQTPFLVQHGSADRICRPEGSKELYRRASSEDKTLKIYEGGCHNLYIELQDMADEVIRDEYSWIQQRLKA